MRWFIRALVALVLLAGVALAALFFIPTDRIARVAADAFQARTGRALELSGEIRPRIWPEIGVTLGAVRVANAPWAGEAPMLSAKALSVGVDPMELLRGQVRVRRLRLEEPVINLVIDENGRGNWAMAGAEVPDGSAGADAGAEADAAATVPAIDEAIVIGGTLRIDDRQRGQVTTVTDVSLRLALPDPDRTARVEMTGAVEGQKVKFEARLDGPAALLAGEVRPLGLEVAAGGSAIALDGRLGVQPMAFDGTVTARIVDDAPFAVAGLSRPALPQGLGQRRIEAEGRVTLASAGTLHLREGVIALDDNRFSANVDFDPTGKRPRIAGHVVAEALDLTALGAGGGDAGGASSAAGAQAGWPTDPIDVSGMDAVDAVVSFRARAIDLGVMRLGETTLDAELDAGRLAIDLKDIGLYEGRTSGRVIINARKGLSVRTNLQVAGVSTSPLLADLADYDRLVSKLDADVRLSGKGGSVDAIMKSLTGDGRFTLGKGEILGFDLVGMITHLDASWRGEGAKTIFDEIAGTFTVNRGVLTNDDLAFEAPLLKASGAGTVDIGRRLVDYRITPVALQGADGTGGVTVPVVIKGPWSDPAIRPDLGGVAAGSLGQDAKTAVEGVKSTVKEKVRKELGVPEGQPVDPDAAVKEKLKNEVSKGLRNLLGGN